MKEKLRNKYSTTYLVSVAAFIICGIVLFSACQDSQEVPSIVVTEVFTIAGEELVVTRILEPTPTPTIIPTPAENNSPVVLDLSFVRESVPNIDPQTTNEPDGIDLIENMFVGLTRYNHATNNVDPALAREWEVSGNGRIWTFHLRDDIFWVRPSEQTIDGYVISEAVRPVVASDVVFAIQRACARKTDTPDAFVLFLIEGCEQAHQQANATPADLANIGVQALNDTTLQINLNRPAAHFLTITTLWLMRPLPRELFEVEEGAEEIDSEDWQTAVQNGAPLLTSGPFMPLSANFSTLQRNTLWPIPFQGNTEIVKINYVETDEIALRLWEAKSLDVIDVINANLANSPSSTLQQLQVISQHTLLYLNFNFQSGVFREPTVRRAFSAAIDREALIEEVFAGEAVPMRHLIPPDVFGAQPVDQVGLGYSPDFARLQMAESGFGNCRLMPDMRFMVSSSDLSLLQAELIIQMWVKELGCDENQFQIEQVQFGTLLANTRADAGVERPDIWELAWASYYPDAHNWMGDLIHCQESENRERRPCGEVDTLIQQAATTVDLAEREKIYRQIENMLFGDEGLFPLVPLYVRGDAILVQNWLTYPPARFGGEQYDSYEIIVDRKELERSRSG